MELMFYLPTKIIMGKNCVCKNSHLFAKTGKKALIITYPISEKNGSIADVIKALREQNIEYEISLDAPLNPEIKEMHRFADIAVDAGVDMIIGIGGGSALDTAKTAAVLAANKIPPEELYNNFYKNKPLPVITIPTTAGSGSEVTPYAVLTIKDKNAKKSFGNEDQMSPVYAFLDASYTETQPGQVAADSAIDALSHAIEGFLSKNNNWVSDVIGVTIFKNFNECKDSLEKRLFTYGQREKLLFSSTLSGIMINHMRTLAVHAMSYPLTLNKGLSHGCACGILLGAFMEYIYPECIEKAHQMYNALGVENTSDFSEMIRLILKYKENYKSEELEQYTQESFEAASAKPNPKFIDIQAVLDIYKKSLMQ